MEILGLLVGGLVLLGIIGYLLIEWQYNKRPGNQLELSATDWRFDIHEPNHFAISLDTVFTNRTRTLEIFMPEVSIELFPSTKTFRPEQTTTGLPIS